MVIIIAHSQGNHDDDGDGAEEYCFKVGQLPLGRCAGRADQQGLEEEGRGGLLHDIHIFPHNMFHQALSLLRSLAMSGASEHKVSTSLSLNNNKKRIDKVHCRRDTKQILGCQQDANLEESQKYQIVM